MVHRRIASSSSGVLGVFARGECFGTIAIRGDVSGQRRSSVLLEKLSRSEVSRVAMARQRMMMAVPILALSATVPDAHAAETGIGIILTSGHAGIESGCLLGGNIIHASRAG